MALRNVFRAGKIQFALCASLATGVVAGGLALASLSDAPPVKAGQGTRKSTDPPLAAHGKLGQDLFLAIDRRDLPGVEGLLKKGADPNSRNGLEFTPLYIAAASHQQDVIQALLDAGAKPDALSTYGTPLTFAAATGNFEGAMLLLAKGAKPDPLRTDGMSPLMMACNVGVPPLVEELIKRKVDVNTQDDGGDTALHLAARQGHVEVGGMLIEAGAKVDQPDVDGITPLMAAAMTGHPDFVRMLLEKGANPNAKADDGRTALLLVADYGDYPEVIHALLDGKANPKAKDSKGRTAAAIAAARGFSGDMKALGVSLKAPALREPRAAVKLSLSLIQQATKQFDESATCVSCHHQGLGRITTGEAAAKGFKIDSHLQAAQSGRVNGMLNAMRPLHEQALKSPEAMKQIPLMEINEISDTDGWVLAGMAANKQPPTKATAAMAAVLARQQAPDGSWTFTLPRVPMQSSFFTFTALAIHALDTYGAKGADTANRIRLAKKWLLSAKPQNSEDRASRLLGLKWAGATAAERHSAVVAILKDQGQDGGWAQLPGMRSDAYATGQALYALHVGGGASTEGAPYQRGERYLLRTQDDDGSWFVNKRAMPANNYFDAGFPHGESQYASYNGTCWATLALMQGLGKR